MSSKLSASHTEVTIKTFMYRTRTNRVWIVRVVCHKQMHKLSITNVFNFRSILCYFSNSKYNTYTNFLMCGRTFRLYTLPYRLFFPVIIRQGVVRYTRKRLLFSFVVTWYKQYFKYSQEFILYFSYHKPIISRINCQITEICE